MDGNTITVGHQQSPSSLNLSSWIFDVCGVPNVCSDLDDKYGPSASGPLAGRWIHLTVIRVIYPISPTCSSSYGVSYQVYLNDYSLGISPVLCPPVSIGSSSDTLYFGAYQPTATSAQGFSFDGYLQEWRMWNGALSQSVISDLMQMPLRRTREVYTGDPTAGSVRSDTYMSSYVLLADYDFDVPCTAACTVSSLVPQYPKNSDPRFVAIAVGNVTSASSDSSGAVFWRSAVSDMSSIVSDGRLALSATGPGQYQVVLAKPEARRSLLNSLYACDAIMGLATRALVPKII